MSAFPFKFSVPRDHPSLAGHFPGRPVVPGVLLIDHVISALEQEVGKSIQGLKQVKFMSVLLPGECAEGEWCITSTGATFRVSVRRGATEVTVAQGSGSLSAESVP